MLLHDKHAGYIPASPAQVIPRLIGVSQDRNAADFTSRSTSALPFRLLEDSNMDDSRGLRSDSVRRFPCRWTDSNVQSGTHRWQTECELTSSCRIE